ncbi:MAG: hypothetical protein QXM76_03955, partial [Zestosphaera sp.]
ILGLLSANPLFPLMVAVAVGVALYKYMSSLSETAVVFLAKPRDLAMEKLKGTEDLDVWLKFPLTSVRNMLLALVFAPPLYYASIIVLEFVLQFLRFPLGILNIAVRALTLIVASAIVWMVVTKMFRGLELNVKIALILSLASAATMYVAGVYRSMRAVGLSVDAFLRPDLLGTVHPALSRIHGESYGGNIAGIPARSVHATLVGPLRPQAVLIRLLSL